MGSGVSPGKDRTTTASLGGNKRRQPFPHDSGRAGEIEERRSVGGKTDFFYADENASSETSTHNSAHTTPSTLYSNATLGMETRARKGKRKRCDATAADAGEAFRGLPNHLVATHILNSEHFDDPADLARLPAVSRAMRDAVTETGLRFEELDEMCALEVGCLSAVQRRQRQGRLSHRQYLCQAAARSGLLEELKELRENGTRWDEFTCAAATKGGHLQVLRWLRTNNCPWDVVTCRAAAMDGQLEVLQWARANGCPWDEVTCTNADGGGHLEMLQWSHAHGCPWDTNTCTSAAAGDNLEVLQWSRENGCPWDEKTCTYAAEGGHLEMLQWSHTNGCPWSGWTCAAAAKVGHLEVLQWARANSCPWDANTCAFAAKGGHLQVLQWLRANGCPWDEWTCEMAVEGEAEMYGLRASGHHDFFVWARENGCPMNDETRNSAGPLGWLGDDDW